MGFFDFLYKGLVRPVGCFIIFILLAVLGAIGQCTEGVVDMFSGTPKHEKLASEVLDMLKEGQIVEAKELCSKEDHMYVYFHVLTSNLQTVYDAQGIDNVRLALSLVPFPSPTEYSLSDEFKQHWKMKDSYPKQPDVAEECNRGIEALCTYLQVKGKQKDIPKVLEFLQLKALYDGAPSNDEVERIKKKFESEE